ncbi:MAG: hypothetical protein R2764_04285 [Bacteroidales bacterium]
MKLRKTTGDSTTATKYTQFNRQAAFLLKMEPSLRMTNKVKVKFNIILSGTKGNDKVHGVVLSPSHTGERTSSRVSQQKQYL